MAPTDPPRGPKAEGHRILGGVAQAELLDWMGGLGWRTDPEGRAMKLAEEAGEVVGAVTKMVEQRKTKFDLADELGDLVLCAMALAESAGIDLGGVLPMRFDFQQRRWEGDRG